MPHTTQMIEHTLIVATSDEAAAVRIAEMFARFMVALSAEAASVTTSVERYDMQCQGEHEHDDEFEVEP